MKHAVIFLTILLLVSLAYAEDEEIFDKYINSTDTFTVNDVDYIFHYSFTSEKALIKSRYSKLILSIMECKEVGYLEFCLVSMTNETEEEDTQFKLNIHESDCIEYQLDNGSAGCKVKIGEECFSDYSCVGKCLHGTCTISYPICGDGYCDGNERCDEDCKVEINETEINETIVNETVEEETIEEPVEQEVIVETLEQEKQPFELKKYLIVVGIPIALLIIVVIIYKVIAAKRKPKFEFKV